VYWLTAPPALSVTCDSHTLVQLRAVWDLQAVGFPITDEAANLVAHGFAISVAVAPATPSVCDQSDFKVMTESYKIEGVLNVYVHFKKQVTWCRGVVQLKMGNTLIRSDFTTFNAETGEVGEPLLMEISSLPPAPKDEIIVKAIYFEDPRSRLDRAHLLRGDLQVPEQLQRKKTESRDCFSVCNYGHFSRALLARNRCRIDTTVISDNSKTAKKRPRKEQGKFQTMTQLLNEWNLLNCTSKQKSSHGDEYSCQTDTEESTKASKKEMHKYLKLSRGRRKKQQTKTCQSPDDSLEIPMQRIQQNDVHSDVHCGSKSCHDITLTVWNQRNLGSSVAMDLSFISNNDRRKVFEDDNKISKKQFWCEGNNMDDSHHWKTDGKDYGSTSSQQSSFFESESTTKITSNSLKYAFDSVTGISIHPLNKKRFNYEFDPEIVAIPRTII